MIDHSREKLINAMIFFAQNTKFCGKTKLIKLLYQLDFRHFKASGKLVTGLSYYAWELGPCPKSLWDEMTPPKETLLEIFDFPDKDLDDDAYVIKPKVGFNKDCFTKRELTLLNSLASEYELTKAKDLIVETHLPGKPWDKTLKKKGKNALISPFLALDDSSESISEDEALSIENDFKLLKKL